MALSYWQRRQWFETCDESERRKCQSTTAFEDQEDENHDYGYNFNIGNKDIKIVEDFAYLGSVINLNGDWNREMKRRRRLRLRGEAIEELGRITKSKDQGEDHSHPKIPNCYVSMQKLESMNRLIEKKKNWFIWNMVLEECSSDILGNRKMSNWVLEQIKPETSLEAKLTRLKLSYLRHMWEGGVLSKDNDAGEK